MVKHIVFDRDGTLIEHKPYLCIPKEVVLLPYVAEGLEKLKGQGYKLYLHTNQSGVARGYFGHKDAVACNNEMLRLINLGDDLFERICIATDYPPKKKLDVTKLNLIKKYLNKKKAAIVPHLAALSRPMILHEKNIC